MAQTKLRLAAFPLLIAALLATAAPANEATAPAAPPETQVEEDESSLAELVAEIERVIPSTWRVVEANTEGTPIGWTGEGRGLYVMVEDTQTRFFHPNGFHYYSFYRVWLMPPDWEGEMRQTPYISDSSPAFLLGANGEYAAFYHTAGGNVWREGPQALCGALGLESICFRDLNRRIVDLSIEEALKRSLDTLSDSLTIVLRPQRILGLTGNEENLYLEYVLPAENEEADYELSELTRQLALNVFLSFPELESLYLRRCGAETFTDTIVTRDR